MATEKRLIDANALSNTIQGISKDMKRPGAVELACLLMIAEAPKLDAVEVVRCEDCKYRVVDTVNGEDWCNHTLGLCSEVYATDFCCHGERRADGEG